MRSDALFLFFRNVTIFFATVMLFKYYFFLLIAPFHRCKETLRKIKLGKQNAKEYFPLVSVIIPACNEEVGIIKTIRSVMQNNYPHIEIIVINNGSTDHTHEVVTEHLKSLDQNDKIIYASQDERGKGTALNHGISQASGEIIVTIDADSVLQKNAIEILVPYFADSSVDAAVGQVRIAKGRGIIGLLQQLEYIFGFYFKRAHSVLGAEYIFGGACAAFRKNKTFDRLGVFETATKTEDIEMSLRVRFHGLNSVYAEDVICYTEGASTVKSLIDQRLRWKKGRFDTFIKYRNLFFSTDKRHNRFLSWMILPYALLSEFQLLFEPIGVSLLIAYSVISGDFISLAIGVLFIFIIYLVVALFNHEKPSLNLILLFPLTWPLFYFLMWVEFIALIHSLRILIKGEQITWQVWDRKGVEL